MTSRHAKVLGPRIRSLREEAGLNQRQLALRVGLTPSGFNRVETGSRMPSLRVFLEIGRALGVSLDELAEGIVKQAD